MGDSNIKSVPLQLPLVIRIIIFMHDLVRDVCTRLDGTLNRLDPSRNLWFRLFVPSHADAEKLLPLIVYFHGSGFTNFGADTKFFNDLCSHLAAGVPAVIVSVNYRLTPEHKYPSQYEDGFDVLKFINANVLPAKADLGKCFIGGDSAGGNIAHHVTVRAIQNLEQFNNIRIIGHLGLQPFFGGEERTESELRLTRAPMITVKETDVFWRDFLPAGADRDHPAANVFGGRANSLKNLDDFPSILVIIGGHDPLQDWDRRYVDWLKNFGKRVELIEYPNAFHGFYAFQGLSEFALLIEDVANFVWKQVNSN
ncbi:hypothetical protein C2S51_027152 [Perilla frutescens var. frutescens]|nr:hypothetical protein C2S51_027152 [Perilla frutescens var. frutescens]